MTIITRLGRRATAGAASTGKRIAGGALAGGAGILAAVALALLLSACGGHSNGSASSLPTAVPTALATAKADAQAYLAACIPSDAAHQILLGKSLLTSGVARQKFATCLAIPPANRPAFEAALLTAAEHVNWVRFDADHKAKRHQFFTLTLPDLAARYHGATATASATVTK